MFRCSYPTVRHNFQQVLLIVCCFLFVLCFILNKTFSSENIEGWMTNRGRYARDYVPPEKYTALSVVKNSCSSSKVPAVLIIVCSAVGNHYERLTIRKTWAENAEKQNVSVLFLVGKSFDQHQNEDVLSENSHYGDIIVEDFMDTYYNLTLKSVMLLKWVQQNCKNAAFVMKMDDDVYMNIENLLKMIHEEYSTSENVFVGKMYPNEKPDRRLTSKWYVPEEIYPGYIYPKFLCGVGFLMSRDVALKLYHETFKHELYFLEDVFITGICGNEINVDRKNHLGFHFFEHPIDVECNAIHPHMILLSHYMTPRAMRRIHAQLEGCKNPD